MKLLKPRPPKETIAVSSVKEGTEQGQEVPPEQSSNETGTATEGTDQESVSVEPVSAPPQQQEQEQLPINLEVQ